MDGKLGAASSARAEEIDHYLETIDELRQNRNLPALAESHR